MTMIVGIDVQITKEAYYKMRHFTQEAKGEIGGLLIADFRKGGTIVVEDAIILEQEASSGSVDLNEEKMKEYIKHLAKNDKERLKKLTGWWHSHSDMNTFWSTTDSDTFDRWKNLCKVCLSINTNKKNDMLIRLDFKEPEIYIDKISHTVIDEDENEDIKAFCQKEIEEKVKHNTPNTGWWSSKNKSNNTTIDYDYVRDWNMIPDRVFWLDDDLFTAFFTAIKKGKIVSAEEFIKYSKKLWEHQMRRNLNKKNKRRKVKMPDKDTLKEWDISDNMILKLETDPQEDEYYEGTEEEREEEETAIDQLFRGG